MNEALYGLIGVIIGVIVTFICTLLTNHLTCRQIFADNVSKSRMEWINKFRDEVGKIVSAIIILSNHKKSNKQNLSNHEENANENQTNINKTECICFNNDIESEYLKLRLNAEYSRSVLLTRLNCDITKEGNEYNRLFTTLLNDINFENPDINIVPEIQELTKRVLENEWQVVKKEAKGVKRK